MNAEIVVSFITVNYNGLADTCQLIRSIRSHITHVGYEIIVVDNASSVDEAAIIAQRFPEVNVVRSETNLGFAGGNNLGIAHAQGEYLFFINNDTYIDSDTLAGMIEFFESSPLVGGLSPKIKYAESPHLIQYAGFTRLGLIGLRNKTIGAGQPDSPRFDIPKPTPYMHGAAMVVRREVITRVGMMPEIYFLYYEELDWSTQITDYGYELWYWPHITVYHKESQSTGKQSDMQRYYLTRNRLLYAHRNRRGLVRLLAIVYQMAVIIIKRGPTEAIADFFSLIHAKR